MIYFRFICGEEKFCLNVKKSTNVLSKIVWKIFLLVFTSLKMHWNFKNDQFLAEKSKTSS